MICVLVRHHSRRPAVRESVSAGGGDGGGSEYGEAHWDGAGDSDWRAGWGQRLASALGIAIGEQPGANSKRAASCDRRPASEHRPAISEQLIAHRYSLPLLHTVALLSLIHIS